LYYKAIEAKIAERTFDVYFNPNRWIII